MNRSPRALSWTVLVALLAAIAGMAVTIVTPATVTAQDGSGPALTLAVSPQTSDQTVRTAAISLDPAGTGLAALGAALVYDAELLVVSGCTLSEVGACNVQGDKVLLSVFNLTGLRANDQLLTIDFEPAAGATGIAMLEVVVTTAVNSRGEQIGSLMGDSIDVDLPAATNGSLTGTVVHAASLTALFAIDVCATHDVTGVQTCTTTTGLGHWRVDDIATGSYSIVADDSTGVYGLAGESGLVVDSQISVVDDMAMAFSTPADDDPTKDAGSDEPAENIDGAPQAPAPTAPIKIVYGASIAGRVTGLETEAAIATVHVCATQPLVLHQSCATTDANGTFVLSGLSTGNYWVEVVDPLGRFAQRRPKLVGVIGDDATRTGVNITLTSAA